MALLVYVDDIIISSPSSQFLTSLEAFLYSQFKLKDLGDVIGLEIGIKVSPRYCSFTMKLHFAALGRH